MQSLLTSLLLLGFVNGLLAGCPLGWASNANRCYFISTYMYDFELARQVCKNHNGELMVINNVEERAFVEKLIRGRGHDVWFGLWEDPNQPGTNVFKWVDNSNPGPDDPDIKNWACEQRPGAGCDETEITGPCGYYDYTTMAWKNHPCGERKIFMCRRNNDVVDNCDIEGGWLQYMSRCYKMMSDKRNWNDAQNQCKNNGGQLVILKEQQRINATRDIHTCLDYSTGVWIGLSDTTSATENTLNWVDGSSSTSGQTYWAEGQPHYSSNLGSNCVAAYAVDESKWRINTCGSSNRYMCERTYGTCSDPWVKHDNTGYCYLVVTGNDHKLSWSDAKAACAAYGNGAMMMKVTMQREQNALKSIWRTLNETGIGNVRLGLSDEQTDNVFKWVDNTNIGYQQFNDTHKKMVDDRMDCGYVPIKDNPNARWGTDYCFDKMPYICQIEIHQTPNTITQEQQQQQADKYDDLACPDGWKKLNSDCYLFSDEKKPYAEAKAFCEEQDGGAASLVTVRNAEEQSFVSYSLKGGTWQGLVYDNDIWVWDGTTTQPGFKNWAADGRDKQDDWPCSRMVVDPPGQWTCTGCGDNRFIICRQPATHTGTETPSSTQNPQDTDPPHPECGSGWVYDSNSQACIGLRTDVTVNWEEARRRCVEDEGAELVSISHPSQQAFINALLGAQVGGASRYWTGLNDRDQEKGWQWTDGSPAAYFNWAAGEPNNAGGQEWCVELVPSKENKWNDHSCTNGIDGYICKKLSKNAVTSTTTGPEATAPPTAAPTCDSPEAMASGNMYVQDQYIIASSQKDGRQSWKARMNSGSTWEPQSNNVGQYVEAYFPFPRMVKQIKIAGAQDKDSFVNRFRVLYQLESGQRWHYVYNSQSQIVTFEGNAKDNKNNGVVRDLPEMVYARGIRIVAQNWTNEISMRFDVHGCFWDGAVCPAWDSVSGETRVIDDRITASGSKEGALSTDIRYDRKGWEASEPSDSNQWVQFEFDCHMRIIEIGIKGHANENRFVKSFTLKVYNPNSPQDDKWEDYQEPHGTIKVFTGNQNNVDEVRITLRSEVFASIVRVIPDEFSGGKAMRIEMKVCPPGCHNLWLVTGPQHSIDDTALTAKSSYDSFHGPARSRLFTEAKDGYKGAWSALENNKEQWIQADVGYEVSMKGVVIQGRQDADQWVKRYNVRYSRDGTTWHDVTWDSQNLTTFTAYFNRNALRTNWFPYAHIARYLRIYPIEWQAQISMRFDIQGCPGPYSAVDVGCYADDVTDRDLPYSQLTSISGGMTREICVTHCHTQGYLFAGTQYGIECFCGNSYGQYGQSSLCKSQCDGDPTQICGGYKANWVQTTGLSPKSKRCADGWKEYNDRCYWFHPSNTYTWGQAEYECKQRDASLVAIHSMAENNFIHSNLAEMGKRAWIGFHALADMFVFEWSNYDVVVFTNWNRREPNRVRDEEDCVEMRNDNGRWNDDPCVQADNAFVCEKAKEILEPAPSPSPSPGCGEGWVAFRWKCYHFLSNGNDWNRHKDNCEGWGEDSHMARIRDNQEQAFLASMINDKGGMFWTDLNDRDNPGTYIFTNGAGPSYTHWGTGQPDQPGSPSCVAMSDGDNGLWFDEDCGTQHGAICEKLSTTETQPPTQETLPPSGACAANWVEYGDYCYLVKEEKTNHQLSWDDAQVYCQNAGAQLASFHSEEENDYFWKLYLSDATKNYWLGLSRATSEESFKWVDGAEVGYVNWKEDSPVTGNSKNCVHMDHEDGRWLNVGCANTRSWLCKIARGVPVSTVTTVAPPTAGPDGSCDPDGDNWKYYNERCYYFGTGDKTWHDADTFCNENGGYLVSIHDADTNYFIMGQIRGQSSYITWMGLNSIEGTEEWSDGTPLDYTNWASGQPNDEGGTKMCGSYGNNAEHYGKWLHRHCSEPAQFMCAKVKGGAPISTTLPDPLPGGCPEGYLAYRDKCFKFVDEAVTWHVARNKCYEENKPYSLASISNRYEQAFLTSQLLNHQHTHWIGMTYNPDSSEFSWTDNTQLQYTNWSPNEPNGHEDEPCVEMLYGEHKAGHWNDLVCEANMGYICMTFKDPNLGDPPKPEYCPEYGMHGEDYLKFNEDCYKAASGSMRTWQEGEDHCRSNDETYGHLTSVFDVYEQAFLESIFLDTRPDINTDSLAWIGLSDKDQEGRFQWSDTRTVTFTNWGENEPDEPGGGCVYFRFSDGKWVDAACQETGNALCKISKKDKPYTRPPAGSCPGSERGGDWIEFGNSCYMFFTEGATLADARHECNLMGSDLVSVHSMDENRFIQDHVLVPHYPQYWWLGMTRTPSSGFQWLDGSPVDFLKWTPGEPSDKNGTQGEDCIDFNSNTASWNDITCQPVNAYICKIARDIATPSTTPEPTFPTNPSSPPSTIVTRPTTKAPTQPPTQPPVDVPSTTAPPRIEEPEGDSSLSAGATVGIVFAVLALVLLALVIGLVVYRREQWKKYAGSEAGLINPSYGAPADLGGDSTA